MERIPAAARTSFAEDGWGGTSMRAVARLRAMLHDSMVTAVAESLDDEQRLVHAGLACTQIVGLFMTRYVWQIEPIASLPADDVVRLIGPTVQRYLSGSLPA